MLLVCLFAGLVSGQAGVTHRYLFMGHSRADGPGQIAQREVERVDFAAYDLLLLGGDYAPSTTSSRSTVDYIDAIFDLSAPTTLASLGNHDTSNKSYFTDVTGRPRYYSFTTNRIAFVVLDTTDDGHNIQGAELQMLADTVNGLTDETHLVVVHHHIIWLADYPPLAHLYGSPLIGASSATLSGLNFYDDVYPLLLQAHSNGVEVVCLAGDRTGGDTEEFYIDHTTADGIRFIAAGLKEDSTADLRYTVVLEHDMDVGTLTCTPTHLTDLPRIPDEPLVINELHYNPSPDQGGDSRSFIELFNRGDAPYDLSGASFATGIGFTFPADTMVAPGDYVVVAADAAAYAGLGVAVFDYDGSARPDSSNPMWLRNARGLEIDYVDYGTADPWPSEPNNLGPSLMLVDPAFDNTLSTSWAPSDQPGGTPGRANIPPPQPAALSVDPAGATLAWNGLASNGWYHIEASPSLVPPDWQSAGAATQPTAGAIELSDTNAPGAVERYYRLSREFP